MVALYTSVETGVQTLCAPHHCASLSANILGVPVHHQQVSVSQAVIILHFQPDHGVFPCN